MKRRKIILRLSCQNENTIVPPIKNQNNFKAHENHKVIIHNFKRFRETEFIIPGDSVVIAGPNNAGKTTLLQAVAAWRLALDKWLELGNTNPGTGYARAPMSRQSFFSCRYEL